MGNQELANLSVESVAQAPGPDAFAWHDQAAAFTPLTVELEAETFIRNWPSFSRPAEFLCSDSRRYVLKALCSDRTIGRAIFNDQTVARLGRLVSAPVGEVALVRLSAELIAANPQCSHMVPGVAHATLRIPDVSERIDAISHTDVPENAERYSSLALLYGWIGTIADRQFIFNDRPPNLVYSVDHGHFFPGGPDWTIATLAAGPQALPVADLLGACGPAAALLPAVYARLGSASEQDVLKAVMASPTAWGVPLADRIALAQYLWERRCGLLNASDNQVIPT